MKGLVFDKEVRKEDAARSVRPETVDDSAIVASTLEPPPEHLGVTHWSSRLLGRGAGRGATPPWPGRGGVTGAPAPGDLPAGVAVTRYRFRGNTIALPCLPNTERTVA